MQVSEALNQRPATAFRTPGHSPERRDLGHHEPGLPRGTAPGVRSGHHEITTFRRVEQTQTAMNLSLTTQDGDRISIGFDTRSLEKGAFDSHAGRLSMASSYSERLNIHIEGNIDEDERLALDQIIGEAFAVAEAFFADDDSSGPGGIHLGSLLASGVANADEIAGFSLKVSEASQTVEHYRREGSNLADHVRQLPGLRSEIDTIAKQTKGLVESASGVLDKPSSVRLVQGLLAQALDTFSSEPRAPGVIAAAAGESVPLLPVPKPAEVAGKREPVRAAPEIAQPASRSQAVYAAVVQAATQESFAFQKLSLIV